MNQSVEVGRLSFGLKKALNQLVYLVSKSPDGRAITHCPAKAALHLPGHLLFVFCRTGDAIQRDLRACRGTEISPLITGRWLIPQNFRPRRVADRREG